MVERIASFKPWWIAALGGVSVLAGLVAVALLATLGYELFPDGYTWVAVFHIAGTGAAFFYIARPFIEAWLFRQLLDGWREHRVMYVPPLDVFDEEK